MFFILILIALAIVDTVVSVLDPQQSKYSKCIIIFFLVEGLPSRILPLMCKKHIYEAQ